MNLLIVFASLILFVTTTSKANEDNEEIHSADYLKRYTKNEHPRPGVFQKKSLTSQRLNYNSKLFQNSVIKYFTRNIEKPKNRLAQERSLHLLQHAKSRVEWYPWGEEAFEKARTEKKLIFLSIGYSSCHWCYIMEHESFDDPDTAAVMNKHFVNIKVDREERPDIDQLYTNFVQAHFAYEIWPLNVFLTPDLKPIRGGTYYPSTDENKRPVFKTILLDMAEQWKGDSASMFEKSFNRVEVIKKRFPMVFSIPIRNVSLCGPSPNPTTWLKYYSQLEIIYDKDWGGFGKAPKYPQPSIYNFLFHVSHKNKYLQTNVSSHSLVMALKTLRKIAMGGIHDHIGQGFARYSLDKTWHVPHFEKMLYDQAQLAVSYTYAYLITKDKQYSDVVHDILQFVNRDLSHQLGGFYSAVDADSFPSAISTKKGEGAYYLWTQEQVDTLLDKPLHSNSNVKLSELFSWHFNVLPHGNVDSESDPFGELMCKNVLIESMSKNDTARKYGISVENVEKELGIAKSILFEARKNRPRPHIDNKIITSWNGLMISAYAKAASALNIEEYKHKAIKAANFLKTHAWNNNTNVLLRACYVDKNGAIVNKKKPIEGFLNDYAFLISGLLDLYDCTLDIEWLRWADKLQTQQDKLFWDKEIFGYWSSSGQDPNIFMRFKTSVDGAEPSGNSISALNLLKLDFMTDKMAYRSKIDPLFLTFIEQLTLSPSRLPVMVSAFTLHFDSIISVFVTGKKDDPKLKALLSAIRNRYSPEIVLVYAEEKSLSPLAKNFANTEKGKVAAYVCQNYLCDSPVHDPIKLIAVIDSKASDR